MGTGILSVLGRKIYSSTGPLGMVIADFDVIEEQK